MRPLRSGSSRHARRANQGRTLGIAAAAAGAATAGVLAFRKDDLHGEVALVAGASRGLGLLIARELSRQGARVAVCARDRQELARAREQLAAEGLDVETFVCDVTDTEQVDRLVAEVEQRLGSVDILVNVAGIIQVAPEETLSDADYESAMKVMFWGPFHLTRAVLPSMRRRRHGRVATVTSIGGKISVPHLLPYSAAKFAAVGWFEGLRAELAGSGVTVTTIVPGLMRTGSHLNAVFGGQQDLEYAWFSVGAAVPVIAMDAEKAARRMVGAIRQRRRVLLLTPLAKVATRVHGLAPSSTVALMEVMGRLLPGPGDAGGRGGEGQVSGREADTILGSTLLRRVTASGRGAAERFNEGTVPGRDPGESGSGS